MVLRNAIKDLLIRAKFFQRLSVACCSSNGLLPGVFVRTSSEKLRELFSLPPSRFETQLNQDIFALLINQFKPGYFVEIGANDGCTLSNTLYLEEHFGWEGLLVEANPKYENDLKDRRSRAVIAAVVDKEGHYEFCDAGLYGGVAEYLDSTHENKTKGADSFLVWGTTLKHILASNEVPPLINFISIDVEGAEVPIVEQLCSLEGFRVACGCIEYNARQADYQRIVQILRAGGYRVLWEGQTQHDLFFVDASDNQ